MSLSTHVLDTARGRPAKDVHVRVFRRDAHGFVPVAEGRTDGDGRIRDWTPVDGGWAPGEDPRPGTYRLLFDTRGYLGEDAFFPEVSVVFTVRDAAEHYHVPLLLSPYGYSTYRGS
ncbi:5-hydroxyisourate hydrolase [Thermobispora bispora]|jgi:5-hydroxyisourate hydrolase|uniref:5-hydroxyisourate hydrolase n=1 Tax=Thermobispora bispora (strain ATCC 19993 / DSM 43833 / CBS 139.67 / JCM 10125 / KCTC 9307 / NBRC 14880 / R51) TaxID=469371 RepID=D6Y9D1_THEBD|nr:hydroxyisourate hydrolase [Thermobispora bispora]ADG88051.1 hydroxyisourate hydrolase [Thermobispora bispora DSM 43833]MBO2474167.1 hydroxyisourate hydrolase [Actinomycetales bacterium]QSI47917.1 hydroxyisourate hydrolase [Thermobispora bispora]